MSLFICDNPDCQAIENTALGQFWTRRKLPRLCSQCATGTWHGRFPKERYEAEKHGSLEIIGQEGAA